MKIDTNKSTIELANVIRSLISFIAIDVKDMIDADKKDEYIKNYLYEISRAMNGLSKVVDVNTITKVIEKDIQEHSEIIKREKNS